MHAQALTADVLKVAAAAVPSTAGTLVQRPAPLSIQRKHLCIYTASSTTPTWLCLEVDHLGTLILH